LEFFRIQNPKKNEILLPEYSFHSNLSSAIKAGFKVKFIPIDKKTLLIDEKKLEQLITKQTLGIIITHMHGKIYDLEKIKKIINKHHLIVFEDCAHSFPIEEFTQKNTWQTNSTVKCLSFGPGKFVTAFGGGALATNNKELFKFVESCLVKNKSIIKDLAIITKTFIYILISSPLISYFTIKPFLALTYLSKIKRNEADSFDQSTNKSIKIDMMSDFQQKLLFLQLETMKLKISKIIDKRKANAKTWYKILKKGNTINQEFCFQFPILVNNPENFIWQMWRKNIDVQKDYCSYLPSLIQTDSYSKTDLKFFERIVYLPTNQYLSIKNIQKIKF
jgi:dTDP-4-amino-4,6-dideoxygalactose transaminase